MFPAPSSEASIFSRTMPPSRRLYPSGKDLDLTTMSPTFRLAPSATWRAVAIDKADGASTFDHFKSTGRWM